jgi:hypothetical protein
MDKDDHTSNNLYLLSTADDKGWGNRYLAPGAVYCLPAELGYQVIGIDDILTV